MAYSTSTKQIKTSDLFGDSYKKCNNRRDANQSEPLVRWSHKNHLVTRLKSGISMVISAGFLGIFVKVV